MRIYVMTVVRKHGTPYGSDRSWVSSDSNCQFFYHVANLSARTVRVSFSFDWLGLGKEYLMHRQPPPGLATVNE